MYNPLRTLDPWLLIILVENDVLFQTLLATNHTDYSYISALLRKFTSENITQ